MTTLSVKSAPAPSRSEVGLSSTQKVLTIDASDKLALIQNPSCDARKVHSFAMEVKSMRAPTEASDRLGANIPSQFSTETDTLIAVSTYANTINWFFISPMNVDSQAFRNEVYQAAAEAHTGLERGCGKYYRGTNAVHVKRLHSAPFESEYNHNHYPLGASRGADFEAVSFPEDVTPDEFRQHLVGFSNADKEMHDGETRFLDEDTANAIADEFQKSYTEGSSPAGDRIPLSDRPYTEEDIQELKENQHKEQPCRPEAEGPLNMSGIDSFKANERQPQEYYQDDHAYVLSEREKGTSHQALIDEIAEQFVQDISETAVPK